jgi:predicted nucleic acid-binding Zn finger protein
MRRSNQIRHEKKALKELLSEIREIGYINDQQRYTLSKMYGERQKRALKAVEEGRVKKYVFKPSDRVVWIIVGTERDYQTIPSVNYCICDDFYFHVISHEVGLCYHLLSQMLAESLGNFELFTVHDRMYEPLMSEWRHVEVKKGKLPQDEIENVRKAIQTLLIQGEPSPINQLFEKVKQEGFDVFTPQHLSMILSSDPESRFECDNGVWRLSKPQHD